MRKFTPGWQPSAPSIKDRYFFARRPAATLPRRTNNRAQFGREPFDQGDLGACGPMSESADSICSASRQGLTLAVPSRLFSYYVTRLEMGTVDEDSGVDNKTMLKSLAKYGWCDEELWPYDIGKFRQRPPQAAWDQAAERAAMGIEYMRVRQTVEEMCGCLVGTEGDGKGDPLIFGFTVYASMLTDEVERTGVVPYPSRNDREMGGHDVMLCDFDLDREEFYFLNSWGQWGNKGYGTVSFKFATNGNIAGDFWTVRRLGAPPPPVPPPQPPVPVPVPNPPAPMPPGPVGITDIWLMRSGVAVSKFKVVLGSSPVAEGTPDETPTVRRNTAGARRRSGRGRS